MEIFVDRRTDRCSRVPTDTSVELVHEDFEEPFEADCVDLSTGGASIRASCLPEVGASFMCRFEDTPSGQSVEVLGRVVWVHLEGERKGEFGVRFIDLDERTEALIARILCEEGDDPEQADQPQDPNAPMSKLLLDGVSTPIAARITHSGGDMTFFEQELPLLRIERGVFAQRPGQQPRRGAIAAVDLRIEGDTPKLVIAVRHQEGGDNTTPSVIEVEQREAEPPPIPPPEPQPSEPAAAVARTEPFGEPVVVATESIDARERSSGFETAIEAGPAATSGRSDLFEIEEDDEDYQWPPRGVFSLREFVGAQLRLWLGALLALKAGLVLRLQPLFIRLRQEVVPLVNQGIKTLSRDAVRLGENRVRLLVDVCLRRFTTMTWFRRKRRTTAVPAAQNAKRKDRAVVFKKGLARFGRMMIFPALALTGGALAVYGFGTWSDIDSLPIHRQIGVASASGDQAKIASDPGEESTARRKARQVKDGRRSAATSRRPSASSVVGSESAVKSGQGEPSVSATSLQREQARSRKSSGPEQTEQRYAGPVFGAREIAGGRSYVLRMSKRVQNLRGIPDRGGFTVIIPGSLSFDRAGPIAASHPLVKRSMILNKGDHAALTIRFVKDARPAYRVIAKGASIEVTIAN